MLEFMLFTCILLTNNFYFTKRIVFLDDATAEERAQLDPSNVPLLPKYYIPRIAEGKSNILNELIANGSATLIVEDGRFTVRLLNTNTGR